MAYGRAAQDYLAKAVVESYERLKDAPDFKEMSRQLKITRLVLESGLCQATVVKYITREGIEV